MRRSKTALALLAIALSACGGEASPELTTTSTSTTTTTVAPTTTTTSTTTTTVGPTTTTTTLPIGLQDIAACRIPDLAYSGVGVGFPRSTDRLQPTGDVQIAVLLADFPDVAAGYSAQEAFALLAGTEEWFEVVSYGRLRIELIPHLEWLRMSEPAGHYADAIQTYEGHKAWVAEAAQLADPEVDFSGIDAIVVLATPLADVIGYGPTWTGGEFPNGSITLDGTTITNGVTSGVDLLHWGFKWLPHELGHSLSFVDLYSYDGLPGFSGEFSMMNDIASTAPEYLAWERWHAGWLDDEQVLCVADDTTVVLEPIENRGGVKAAVIPVDASRVVVMESRRALGYDWLLDREGTVVYVVDTSIFSGFGPIEVVNDQLALLEGDSVVVDGVTVTVLDATDEGDTVRIEVG